MHCGCINLGSIPSLDSCNILFASDLSTLLLRSNWYFTHFVIKLYELVYKQTKYLSILNAGEDFYSIRLRGQIYGSISNTCAGDT